MTRTAKAVRATSETDIGLSVDLDGTGEADVETGVGFFDHMLCALARHSLIDLTVRAKGDTEVDDTTPWRTRESCSAARSPRRSATRRRAAVWLGHGAARRGARHGGGGPLRPWRALLGRADRPRQGGHLRHRARARVLLRLAREAGITLHLRLVCGENAHHIIEATFKAAARACARPWSRPARRGRAVHEGLAVTGAADGAAPIVVVDYHKGNLRSVERGLVEAGGAALVSDDPATIAGAAALVLPGVGSFGDAMGYLRESGEGEAIVAAIRAARRFWDLLGLLLLFDYGTETDDGSATDGLGVLRGGATRLESSRLKVPHVGWDQLDLTPLGHACPLFAGVAEGAHVYFTHSFALADDVPDEVVTARTHYARSLA